MSAQILLLAALQGPPKERSFRVAGTHTSNIFGRIQNEPFEFQVLKPQLLQGATPGEWLLIEARLQPLEDQKGQLLIIPSSVTRLGQQQSVMTERGYSATTGLQRVTVAGNLAGQPNLQDFGKGLYSTSFSVELSPNARRAALEVTVYGESALALSKRGTGDRYTATGHLKTELAIDPRGRETTQYTFLADRADIEDAETFKRRASKSKNRNAGPVQRTSNKRSAGENRQREPQPQTVPPAPNAAPRPDVADLIAPGPKERRTRTPATPPFTETVAERAEDSQQHVIDLKAVTGSVSASLDALLTPADPGSSTPAHD